MPTNDASDRPDLGTLLALGRLAIGSVALLRPQLASRPWLGSAEAGGTAGRVLGRALGGRDVVLALGALASRGSSTEFKRWVLAGALADAADAVATLSRWRSLPRSGRLGILGVAGGAALAGALVATN